MRERACVYVCVSITRQISSLLSTATQRRLLLGAEASPVSCGLDEGKANMRKQLESAKWVVSGEERNDT